MPARCLAWFRLGTDLASGRYQYPKSRYFSIKPTTSASLRRASKLIAFLRERFLYERITETSYEIPRRRDRDGLSLRPCSPSADGAADPNVQKAKDILLKGVASGNPDTRQLAVQSASLIGDRSEVLNKLYSMLEQIRTSQSDNDHFDAGQFQESSSRPGSPKGAEGSGA